MTSANLLHFGPLEPLVDRRQHSRSLASRIRPQREGRVLSILNMSRRGMALDSRHPLTVGGYYLFELVEDGRTLLVEGQVRWCERRPRRSAPEVDESPLFRAGVAFVGVQNRDSSSFVEQLPDAARLAAEQAAEAETVHATRVARLEEAGNPDEAAECVLDLLSPDFEHLLLFRVDGNELRTWAGRGPGLMPARLRRLRLDLDQASIFLHLKEGGSFFFGRLPAMFPHLQLVYCWQGSLRQECAVFPVRIKDRLVSVLYVDTAEPGGIAARHLGILQTGASLFSRCLVAQILRRKSSSRPG
jgi:hypothetical protein